MNYTLNKLIIFTVGAAIGSAVTWKLLKTKYEKLAQEEIDSVKEVFSERYSKYKESDAGEETSEKSEDNQTMTVEEFMALKEKPDIREYAAKLQDLGYTNYSKTEPDTTTKKEDDSMERPYVIPPEELGEFDDYTTTSLIYFADGVLTDDQYEPVEDADHVVGTEFANHFGVYEDDSVCIRNDERKCDYEILADLRKYSDVINSNPHLAEDE